MNNQTDHLTKERLKVGTNEDEMPTHLDLFSGIGGFALAAGWAGFKTIGFCDNEPYAQAVLKKHWPDVPIHNDIKTLDGTAYRGVTLLTGGFPCQPFSNAGKRRGKTDDRYLWPEMLRVIREAKPRWIIGENVAGIVNMALDQVHTDLEGEGYEVESVIIPACSVDAQHRRDRVWILANSERGGRREDRLQDGLSKIYLQRSDKCGPIAESSENVADSGRPRQGGHQRIGATGTEGIPGGHPPECGSYSEWENVAHATTIHAQGLEEGQGERELGGGCRWLPEPGLGRVAYGVSNRTHRLKGLGNAIVPQVAYQIIKGIRELL